MLTNSRRVYKQIVKEQKPLAVNGREKDTAPVIKYRFGMLSLGMLSPSMCTFDDEFTHPGLGAD
jgi:hypothetical protein